MYSVGSASGSGPERETQGVPSLPPVPANSALDAALFRRFRELAYRHAGINLKSGKEALVAARVMKRLRALGLQSPRQYLRYLEADQSGEELIHFLDVISTNFTSFYRERPHFDLLRSQLRDWIARGRRRLRFWSVAASTGQEPYTIAACVDRAVGMAAVDWRILGTDISLRALKLAEAAQYRLRTLEPFSEEERRRYFRHRDTADGERWVVRDRLRSHVLFRRLNLAAPPYPLQGPLDVIFCRNVMIYFDREVRQGLVTELERLLAPGGLLMVGHAESLGGLDHGLRGLQPSVYRKEKPDA